MCGRSMRPHADYSAQRSRRAAISSGFEIVIQFFFCLVTGIAISLLKLADEFFRVPLYLRNVIVGKFSPLTADVSFQLGPFAFKNVLVHVKTPFQIEFGQTA